MVATMLAAGPSRLVNDAGLVFGLLGALVLAWGAAAFLTGSQDEDGRRRERIRTLVGASLIAAAFLLLLLSRAGGAAKG